MPESQETQQSIIRKIAGKAKTEFKDLVSLFKNSKTDRPFLEDQLKSSGKLVANTRPTTDQVVAKAGLEKPASSVTVSEKLKENLLLQAQNFEQTLFADGYLRVGITDPKVRDLVKSTHPQQQFKDVLQKKIDWFEHNNGKIPATWENGDRIIRDLEEAAENNAQLSSNLINAAIEHWWPEVVFSAAKNQRLSIPQLAKVLNTSISEDNYDGPPLEQVFQEIFQAQKEKGLSDAEITQAQNLKETFKAAKVAA